jgi:hypothetical protein
LYVVRLTVSGKWYEDRLTSWLVINGLDNYMVRLTSCVIVRDKAYHIIFVLSGWINYIESGKCLE